MVVLVVVVVPVDIAFVGFPWLANGQVQNVICCSFCGTTWPTVAGIFGSLTLIL